MKSVFANDRLRLSVTDCCNFTCVYCTNEGQLHNRGNYIALEFVNKLAERIILENIFVRKLNITGGEPLLHPQIMDIIKICTEISDSVTVNTNGELLNQEKIQKLYEIGVKNIKFGIDSFLQKMTKLGFKKNISHPDKIIDNLLFAVKLMPRSSVNIVLTDFNYYEIDQTMRFILENKINWVEFLELIRYDFRGLSKTPNCGPKFLFIINKFKSLFSEISYNKHLAKYICKTSDGLVIQFAEDFCMRRVCKNLWTRIDSKGSFVPCIKAQKGISIDFNRSLEKQIMNCNSLMCNGPKNHLPRDYSGNLIDNGAHGNYIKPEDIAKEPFEIFITNLDP